MQIFHEKNIVKNIWLEEGNHFPFKKFFFFFFFFGRGGKASLKINVFVMSLKES